MAIHEECGVFGVFSTQKKNVAAIVYYGLYALQHRGQESCGIIVNHDGRFAACKDLGLVGEVFSENALKHLPDGNMAVGHVRYGTTGENTRNNCQPIEVNHQKGRIALAHNGNLSNAFALRNELELTGAIFHTTSDTETIAYMVIREQLKTTSIEDAIRKAMSLFEGAYSLVFISSSKMIAARDPHGFRPLCYGKMSDNTFVVASESCALTAVGATFIRDISPGEILIFSENGVTSQRTHCNKTKRKTCIFEYIYFARADSIIDGISVSQARTRAGELLAKEDSIDADIVIGVPDSGLDAALGYSNVSGIPYGIGLIKNKYIGRTFISPKHDERLDQVRIKLSPVKSVIDGKRVVLIDDSIVRGTTSKRIVKLLRDTGAKEIHMRISAPPFLHPCYYGTNIDSEENLIASHHSINQMEKMIGVDTLKYLPVEKLSGLVDSPHYCSACFDGQYPTNIPVNLRKNVFEGTLL